MKDRSELARLYAFIENYEEAILINLKHNEYRQAYKYIWKVSEEFREKEMVEGFKLCFSVRRNEVIKDRKEYLEKYKRLLKVHKRKELAGEPIGLKVRENEDMYSEMSVSSKAASSWTMSTTTGMRKKKDKKKSILTRNVKEGSPIEEEYLLAHLANIEGRVGDLVSNMCLI